MISLFKKRIQVPATNETKPVEVAQTWEVRWVSRYGDYSGEVRPEVEVFLSEAEAAEFMAALQNAFKLLRHSGKGTRVEMRERQ